MRWLAPVVLMISVGCIEYTPTSTVEPVGVANPRPLATPTHTDKIVQVQQPQVDILWVIDNSCSMHEEQTALTKNFPVFLDYFLGSGLDYHIGVISTDMNADGGNLEQASGYRYIDQETENPEEVFAAMAGMGTGGSGTEKGLDTTYSALELKKDGFNAGFLREEAGLHVVAISDEKDQSTNVTVGEFINWMSGLRWNEDMVTFSSIVSPDPVCATAYDPGFGYLDVTRAIGGIEWSICSEEWGEVLELLGLQASGLKREYFLSQLPVPDTIEVRVVEAGVTYTFAEEVDWVYNEARNSIVFNEYIPSPLAEVYVEYSVLAALEEDL